MKKETSNPKFIPEVRGYYWYVCTATMKAQRTINQESTGDRLLIEWGNCFQTEEEATQILFQISKIFKQWQ